MSATALAGAAAACGGGNAGDRAPVGAPPDSVRRLSVPGGARIALDGEGLRLVDTTTGSTRALAFGLAADSAIAAVAAVAGPPRERSRNDECGAGPLDFVVFPGGLHLNLQEERFVGWSVQPPDGQALRTMSGIGLGATRTALESAYTAQVEETTLGTEFLAGGLQGLLASAAPGARITDLWAGTNCVMR